MRRHAHGRVLVAKREPLHGRTAALRGRRRGRGGISPPIQIEMTYAPLRLASVMLPVSSLAAEAHRRAPEIAALSCVSVTETATY